MTISTEGRGMQPTGNSSYGITGILELVTEGLFPVVASGKFETNIEQVRSVLWLCGRKTWI